MPNDFHTIPIDQIVVGDRFRKELDGAGAQSIEYLAESIKKANKLLHPIVVERVNGQIELRAGGRRLSAIKRLGWEKITAHFIHELSEVQRREIELEENLARKNLTLWEEVNLTAEIDKLKREIYGPGKAGRPVAGDNSPEATGWGYDKTASLSNTNVRTVVENIRLAHAVKVMPSLAKETSRSNALRTLDRLTEDFKREVERRGREKEAYASFSSFVKCGDATSLILDVPNESIDCIITDPPYGVDVGHGGGHRMEADFDDSPEAALAILRSIAPQCRRVLKSSGHLYAFFGPALWR